MKSQALAAEQKVVNLSEDGSPSVPQNWVLHGTVLGEGLDSIPGTYMCCLEL